MKTLRLYTDAEGETHIDEQNITLAVYAASRVKPPLEQSDPQAVGRLVFFHFRPGTAGDWHTAPRRQYLILQSGELEITPSVGAARTLRAGDSMLIEDTAGKGHLTRTLGSNGARGVFVHLAEERP